MNQNTLALATALRRELHARPELSGCETWTKQRLQDFLRCHTSLALVDRGAWFYGYRKGKGAKPPIAFRAEMDAIAMHEHLLLPYASTTPGVAHKCGHDGHCAVLAAFAMETEGVMPERDIYYIFQHAEETGQGAQACVSLIREQGIEEVFAFHNMSGRSWGEVALRTGTMNCASQGVALRFIGVPAHASLPETGRSPALAVADSLRASMDSAVRETFSAPVWCTPTHVSMGSESFGIAAGEAKALFTCRGECEADMQALSRNFVEAARAFALRDGLEVDVSLHDVFPETVNHPDSVEKIRSACVRLGFPFHRMEEPMRASEDVGHFFKAAKGALFLLHTGNRSPIHTPEYDFDDTIIERAVTLFTALL